MFIYWSGVFLQWVHIFSFLSLSFSRIACPILWGSFPYIVPSITSQPSIYTISRILFGCFPIKTLLDVVGGTVSCEDTVQVSFLHKCGQFSWCSALNVKVAVTFPAISSFHYLQDFVTFLGAQLSSMVDYLNYFQGASTPWGPQSTHRFPFSPRSSYLHTHGSLIILESLIILRQGAKPNDVLWSLAPTNLNWEGYQSFIYLSKYEGLQHPMIFFTSWFSNWSPTFPIYDRQSPHEIAQA